MGFNSEFKGLTVSGFTVGAWW